MPCSLPPACSRLLLPSCPAQACLPSSLCLLSLPPHPCSVHHPAINEAVQLVQQAAASCGVEPYDEASGTGQLRYVQLTVVQPPEGAPAGAQPAVQLVLVWNGVPDSADSGVLAALAGSLWQAAGLAGAAGRSGSNSRQLLHSVWANYNEERTNTILGPTWKLLHGEEMAWARLGGADVCFGPGSFMQVWQPGWQLVMCCLLACLPARPPAR